MSFSGYFISIPPVTEDLITPFWAEKVRELERDFLPDPPSNFQQQGTIAYTMAAPFCEWSGIEYAYIKALFKQETLEKILTEPDFGAPAKVRIENFNVSGNTIHHAYHLARWITKTGLDLPKNVVEWGGGYGNLARIYKTLVPDVSYTIIDLPILTCLQWHYLEQLFPGKVFVAKQNEVGHDMGGFTLVPVSNKWAMDNLQHADLFISTWALSESPKACQDLCVIKKFWHAPHVLMAGQSSCGAFPCATELKDLIGDVTPEEIPFLGGNFYLLK